MATRKPAPKPKPKPTPKPLPRPKPEPLDLVRSPNFDAAMAQQEYQNLVRQQSADIRARISAEQNAANALGVKYIATMGTSKTMQPVGKQDFIDSRDKFNPNLMPEEEKQRLDKLVADFAMQGAGQRESDIARRNALLGYNNQTYGSYVNQQAQQGFGDVAGTMSSAGQLPSQQPFNPNAPSLMPIYNPGSNPQAQQMQNYQNFLQQGMQNSNTLNQGAMAGFANMQPRMQGPQAGVQVPQPGMQVPQAGIGQTKGPNMFSMGMQQRRPNPPRKFSTVSNSPARFA